MNHTPPTPRRGDEGASARIPEDWKLPGIDTLPAAIAALARQWPAGAYEAEGEAFHQHWKGRGHRRVDWAALWASRVQARHVEVMRAVKAGVVFGSAGCGSADTAPAVDRKPIAAKRREDERSAELHEVLADTMGARLWEQWVAPAALVFDDCGLTVVAPTAFHRTQLETHHAAAIEAGLAQLGRAVDWTRFESAEGPDGKSGKKGVARRG